VETYALRPCDAAVSNPPLQVNFLIGRCGEGIWRRRQACRLEKPIKLACGPYGLISAMPLGLEANLRAD